ncbi:MAG: ATP/GTP-binding protein [Rhodocyclaceae bacterium]|nr:ATP/GTP-binding protein [Rhodocyclaceae bacterium]
MSQYKIIFTGPVGAGKTTAIAALSDIAPVSTDAKATDMTRDRKEKTTVAMDYGAMRLEDGGTVHLYGTPGQERFDFMWEILTEGGIGLVLLIDNARENPFSDLRFYMEAFGKFIRSTAVVVGVSRFDLKDDPTIEAYNHRLEAMGFPNVPVFEVDARDRRDISLLVEALLSVIDPVASA